MSLPQLSDKQRLVLEALSLGRERYGLEMVQASAGTLKRGTIYVTLSRMEDRGLVTSRKEQREAGTGPARRLYKITGDGERLLAIWRTATQAYGSWGLA